MKLATTRSLVLAIVMLGLLAAAPMAYAVATNHSGAICKNYNAGEVTLIDYLISGTRSFKTSATNIICPLTRNTSNGNGAWVYVDVFHNGTQTTTCAAYSINTNGSLLAAVSQPWTGSGSHKFAIDLTGTGKSNSWSDYSVLCTIPGDSRGVIHGVDLNEQ